MLPTKYIRILCLLLVSFFFMLSCEKDYYYVTPPPRVATATATLEASYFASAPLLINSSYWNTADFLKVTVANVNTQSLYSDGLLNMTGTYYGLTSFNGGKDPGLTLKAAYDNNKLYLLAEWTDSELNIAHSSWLYGGPADPLKTDTTSGWTSQRNNDQIAFAFEVDAASSSNGTFANKGCAASCHSAGPITFMHPAAGKVDIWNWSLARSAPMGYAIDMVADQNALTDDSGDKMYVRNVNGSTDRSGPAYEWNGVTQSINVGSGTPSTLAPEFYLYNKTPFTGNMAVGDSIFHSDVLGKPGHCATCHGAKGEGAINSAINSVALNRKSRNTLMQNMDNVSDMTAYWNNNLTSTEKDDIIAYVRGLCGIPGYYLQTPTGSNADIIATSNVTPVQIINAILPVTNVHTKYKVLLVRNLKTNNADDVQMNIATNRTYKFGVALMDNDGRNHIGSIVETLTFK